MKIIRTVDEEGFIRYKNEKGDLHRIDGPAINYEDRHEQWLINGELHREDGPAIIHLSNNTEYWLRDNWYTKENWERERLKWLDHRGFPMSANKDYD